MLSENLPTLRLADPRFGADALTAIEDVLTSGRLTQGPKVEEFERAIADFCGVKGAVATTSATTALELVLAALDIGPGDEVIVADFTYPATANAVLQRGAVPKLVDVDIDSYCVDPAEIEGAISRRTAAVIAVDVFGLPADYPVLEPMLAELGIPLICDAACSLGAGIGARRCGSFGLASCFSFHPRKSLTTGEGGMVTTDHQPLAKRLRRLRNHGGERTGWRTTFVEPGFNYRMSELNAALGVVQVARHRDNVDRRRRLAAILSEALSRRTDVTPQHVPNGRTHPYQAYVVRLPVTADRDRVIQDLAAQGIESTLGTYALHAEPAFERACGTRVGDVPRSLQLSEQTLALPLHQRLSEGDIGRIVRAVEAALASAATK
jgi:perosamine synthetase